MSDLRNLEEDKQKIPAEYPAMFIDPKDPTKDIHGDPIPHNGPEMFTKPHDNGSVLYHGPWEDNGMQGRGTCWHNNGNIRLVGTWDKG